jgi:hypothetical protein
MVQPLMCPCFRLLLELILFHNQREFQKISLILIRNIFLIRNIYKDVSDQHLADLHLGGGGCLENAGTTSMAVAPTRAIAIATTNFLGRLDMAFCFSKW